MSDSADILKTVADSLIRGVAALPRPVFTFPLHAALSLGNATLGTFCSFVAGSRSAGLQIAIATLMAFLAALVPVEDLCKSLQEEHKLLGTLIFLISVGSSLFLAGFLPEYLVPVYERQQRMTRILYCALGGLFVLNLIWAGAHALWLRHCL